ncbi:MerR family transcriptional regulator [Lactiplantibacillus garii]|uniref:MerR family transcriptional regulator n=1 Tax=Lactiplantibacillus garii TaxID=2306423 RepID=A0A426D522_9LACO|nr:MerR family transcriptional regulator [Lactiplantibacillus garii]RRK09755.1 MerR family transcriptional regulator [Lactiplantibacillus garii]
MTYTIKEVAERTDFSIYTLRYYDKAGLLPFVSRDASGYRAFTDGDLQILHTIACLKDTGMKIAAIRQYVTYIMQGPSSIPQRKQLLEEHRQTVLHQQAVVAQSLKEIDFKLAMYSSPHAAELVGLELQTAKSQKRASQLADPFEG